jgi:hypothetical protein
LPTAPDVLKVPSTILVSTTLVDDVSFWRAPGQPHPAVQITDSFIPQVLKAADLNWKVP